MSTLTMPDVMSEAELREYLRLAGPRKTRTWYRLRPYLAPALFSLPTTYEKSHRLYDVAKVRQLLDARRLGGAGLSRSNSLRRVA